MISDFKLKAIVSCCLVVLSISLIYGLYTIHEQELPNTFSFCMIGIMGSMYIIGLTFDRYRRAMYVEARLLYQKEQLTVSDLRNRINIRDITIAHQRDDLERQQLLSKRSANDAAEVRRRISLVIDNLNTVVDEAVATTHVNYDKDKEQETL